MGRLYGIRLTAQAQERLKNRFFEYLKEYSLYSFYCRGFLRSLRSVEMTVGKETVKRQWGELVEMLLRGTPPPLKKASVVCAVTFRCGYAVRLTA